MSTSSDPESKAREVVDACADCDCCRPPMDPPCAVFAELYRLWDRQRESGERIGAESLRRMVDLCSFCALCPCPNIRADLIEAKTLSLSKTIYGGIFKDEGYFSSIDPLARIQVAENTWDLGEYLLELHDAGDIVLPRTAVQKRLAYFAPCHQREQEIGTPYAALMNRIPGSRLELIDGRFYCCGMAGIMGFKKDFRNVSVQMGRPLFEQIWKLDPEVLVTDCLSCRLQFQQHLP